MDSKIKAALFALVAMALVVGMGVVFLAEDDPSPTIGGGREGGVGGGGAGATPTSPGTDAGSQPMRPNDPPARTQDPPRAVGETPASAGSVGTRPGPDVRSDPQPIGAQATFEVQCTDAEGTPLAGVRIEARRQSGAPLTPAVTDSRGLARIGGVTVGERVSGAGRSATSAQPALFGPVKVDARTLVRLEFTASSLGILEGTLFDDGGNPIRTDDAPELLLINPKSPEGKAALDAQAMNLRPDGTFQARIAAGAYSVSATANGRSESDRTYVTVTADAPVTVNLVLKRAGSISGTVSVPRELSSSLPLTLEVVAEIRSGSPENPHTLTKRIPITLDASMTFKLEDCEAGRWRMRVEYPESGGRLVGPWHMLILQPAQSVTGYSMKLSEVMVSLKGSVRDDQGLPLEGAEVSVGARRATSAQDGTFELRGLDMGKAWLEATLEGHAPAVREIMYRGAQLQLDVVLQRLGGVQGEVVRDGKPAAFVDVVVCFKEEDGVRPTETKTDGQGRYRLEGLPPATYYLKAGPGADPFESSGAPTVTVRPGTLVDAPRITAE